MQHWIILKVYQLKIIYSLRFETEKKFNLKTFESTGFIVGTAMLSNK